MNLCSFASRCGGCPNINKDADSERSTKLRMVQELLERRGIEVDLEGPPDAPRTQYRARLRMACVDGVVGYYNSVKERGCVVLDGRLEAACQSLMKSSKSGKKLFQGSGPIEVRVSDSDNRLGLWVSDEVSVDHLELSEPEWLVSNSNNRSVALRYDLIHGLSMSVPLQSFVQVNQVVMRQVLTYVEAVASSHLKGRFTFLDLYGGVGPYSTVLSSLGATGMLVEQDSVAVAAAAMNCPSLAVYDGSMESQISVLSSADFVVVNPGRAGLKSTTSAIAELVDQLLVYVSCDPATLARDLWELRQTEIEPISGACFDMFSGTDHVETVVVCQKRPS